MLPAISRNAFFRIFFIIFAAMNNELILHSEQTGSTNRDLAELIQAKQLDGSALQEFLMLRTDYQTAGRGQGSNRWFSSEKQNLLCSIYFRPPIPANRQFVFNQYFALAVRQFLLQFCNNVKIKWPNDIYVDGKKIAGILIEHSVMGDKIRHTIAGIGLNVNEKQFPDELPNPISLYQITNNQYDIKEIARQLLLQCQELYAMILEQRFEELRDDYLQNLYQINEWKHYEIANNVVEARITGLDPYGRLQLEGRGGQAWCCGLKEVRFL